MQYKQGRNSSMLSLVVFNDLVSYCALLPKEVYTQNLFPVRKSKKAIPSNVFKITKGSFFLIFFFGFESFFFFAS